MRWSVDLAVMQSTRLAAETRADRDLGTLLEAAQEHGINFDDYADTSTTPEMFEGMQSLARELQSRQHQKGYSRADLVELIGVSRSTVDRILDVNPDVGTREFYAIAEFLKRSLECHQRLPLDKAMAELASKFSEKSNLEADRVVSLVVGRCGGGR